MGRMRLARNGICEKREGRYFQQTAIVHLHMAGSNARKALFLFFLLLCLLCKSAFDRRFGLTGGHRGHSGAWFIWSWTRRGSQHRAGSLLLRLGGVLVIQHGVTFSVPFFRPGLPKGILHGYQQYIWQIDPWLDEAIAVKFNHRQFPQRSSSYTFQVASPILLSYDNVHV